MREAPIGQFGGIAALAILLAMRVRKALGLQPLALVHWISNPCRQTQSCRVNSSFQHTNIPDNISKVMAIRAFLSFVEEDLNLVNLFRGQAKNERFDLEFDDYSIKVPFDSQNASYIGQGISAQIRLATLTVCLYGPTTYQSRWVIWELSKTLELGKPIMGVYLYSDGRIKYYPSPLEKWPRVGWNIPEIVQTMERLATAYRRR